MCRASPSRRRELVLLLLLARLLRRHVLLVLELGDLAKHDNTVTVEEGNTGETLARLEGIADESLDGGELNLGHFVGL